MTQFDKWLFGIIGWGLSPTLMLAKLFKRKPPEPEDGPNSDDQAARFVRAWNVAFLAIASSTFILLCAIGPIPPTRSRLLVAYLWILPFGRINEIFYAFLRDGLDRIKKKRPEIPSLTPYDRVLLVARSYLEVVINFGLLYYLGFPEAFSSTDHLHVFKGAVEAFYFSAVTITTVGYGDFVPSTWNSQLLVVYEVLGGLVLILLALGAYIDSASKGPGPCDQEPKA